MFYQEPSVSPASVTTLDSLPYAGEPITALGWHELWVSATDLAGNHSELRLSFKVRAPL